MSRIARILASGTTLLLAVAFVTGSVSANFFDEIADAQKDLAQLAKLYADARRGSGKVDEAKVKELTEAMKKKYDGLDPIMSVYKPTKNKGIGFNPAKRGPGDGLEKRLSDLATKKPLSKDDLARDKELLVRMAVYNLAIHDVARQFTPTKPKAGKGAKEWTKYNTEMKEGSEELLKAVEGSDPAGLKKAAGKISAACNDCHTDFR